LPTFTTSRKRAFSKDRFYRPRLSQAYRDGSAGGGTAPHAVSDMLGQAHALVKDPHDSDAVRTYAIDDDMRSDEAGLMGGRQIVPMVAELRIADNRLQGIIELAAIRQQLVLAQVSPV